MVHSMERSFTFLDMVLSECGREGERGRERGVHHCMAQTQSLRATLILTLEPSHTHICIHNKSIARMFATIRCDVHSFVSTARNRCRPARDQRTATASGVSLTVNCTRVLKTVPPSESDTSSVATVHGTTARSRGKRDNIEQVIA